MSDRTETILMIIIALYVVAAIASFGHSANKAMNDFDEVAAMNALTLGAAWPFYASYIYFEEQS